MKLLSDKYKALLVEKHTKRPWGGGGASWLPHVEEFFETGKINTVLDYGCGRHTFKQAMAKKWPNIEVREYDPGVPGFDALPEPADFVLCTDVLEHIEAEYLSV